MRSFELPEGRWIRIERELRDRIDVVAESQKSFSEVEERTERARERLRRVGLERVLLPGIRSRRGSPALDPSEALAFVSQHPEESAQAGYRSAVRRIEEEHGRLCPSPDLLRQLHRELVAGAPDAGEWKTGPVFFPICTLDGRWHASRLTPDPASTLSLLDALHDSLRDHWASNRIDRLLVIAAYWLDLVAIHPFADGNGRVARLASLLLLYQAGHFVCRRASLEAAVARKRAFYLQALLASLEGWDAASHDPTPWCRFVVDLVADAYATVRRQTEALTSVVDEVCAIREAIVSLPDTFGRRELRSRLPCVREALVDFVLRRMTEASELNLSVQGEVVEWTRNSGHLRRRQ